MHVQENSAHIRRYIHPVTYFKLQQEQELKSLIYWDLTSNNFIYSKERILKRILELETLERQGFVFIGEKNWLQDCLATNFAPTFETYEKWVIHNFRNYLNILFKRVEDGDDFYGKNYENSVGVMWKGNLKFENRIVNFEPLANVSYNYLNEEINLYVIGNEDKPLSNYLCKLFEILHNFEYYVNMIPPIVYNPPCPPYIEELKLKDIFVEHPVNADFWSLSAISEYGADMEEEFYRNGRISFPY